MEKKNELNKIEVGLEELVSAMNTTLPRDVIVSISDGVKRLRDCVETDNYPFTNRFLISMYNVLLSNGIGPDEGKRQFNMVQKKWVNSTVLGHEKEIFSDHLLQTLINYHQKLDEFDSLILPDMGGARIEMNNGCVYKKFCDVTDNRKCVRGPAIKHIVNYFHPEPYQFLLEKPFGSNSCIIRVIPNASAGEVLRDYQNKGQAVIIL